MSWLLVSGRVVVAARAIERYDSRGTSFDKTLTDPLSALGAVRRSPAAPMRANMTGMSEQGALEQGDSAGRVERQTTSDFCRIVMSQTVRPRLISKRPPSPLPSTRTCRSDRYRPHRDKARSFLGKQLGGGPGRSPWAKHLESSRASPAGWTLRYKTRGHGDVLWAPCPGSLLHPPIPMDGQPEKTSQIAADDEQRDGTAAPKVLYAL